MMVLIMLVQMHYVWIGEIDGKKGGEFKGSRILHLDTSRGREENERKENKMRSSLTIINKIKLSFSFPFKKFVQIYRYMT